MREYLSTGCLILGILCFLYYIGITIYAGFRTSIAFIWVLGGGVFLFLSWAHRQLTLNPDSPLRLWIHILWALILVGIFVILLIGSRIVSAMHTQPRDGLDYVLVLGAQVKGTRPSRSLRRRLDRAVEYAENNQDTIFVLSGGKGDDEDISEADCMYQYLCAQGMEPSRLLIEDQSTSTYENMIFSDKLYHLKDKNIGIISNNFHIYRAVAIAQKAGYQKVMGVPASADPGMQPHNIVREIMCVLLGFVRGNI